MKAAITIGSGGKEGGANAIRDQVRGAIRKKGSEAYVKLDKTRHVVTVEGDISKEELEGILTHTKIPYNVEYEEEKTQERAGIPADYWTLRQRVEDQREQIIQQKGNISELGNQFTNEQRLRTKEVGALQAIVADLRAKCEQINVQDFVAQTMIRERMTWQVFVKSYTETLQDNAELYEFSLGELEERVLHYIELIRSPEFVKIKPQWERAKKAEKMAKTTEYVSLDPEARRVIDVVNEMIKKDEGVTETRKELLERVEGKVSRVIVTTPSENETRVVLPLDYKGAEITAYPTVERHLLESVEKSLKGSKLDYSLDSSNGTTRYTIKDMGKRSRGRLIKAIAACEDPFVILGGQREVLGIETCH